jgi:predicted acylesterase/phospholipase RssA
MKKLIAITLILISISIFSQDKKRELPPAEERAQIQTEMMKEKLGLNEDQVKSVHEINLESAKEMDEVIKLESRIAKFKKYRAVQLKKDKKLKKVLSEEQFEKYEEFKEEMKKKLKKLKEEREKSNK